MFSRRQFSAGKSSAFYFWNVEVLKLLGSFVSGLKLVPSKENNRKPVNITALAMSDSHGVAVRVCIHTLINLELPAFKNGRIRDDGCSGHIICCRLFEQECAISWESDLQTDDPSSDKPPSSAAKWSSITETSPSWSGFAAFCLREAQNTPGFSLTDSVIFFQGLKQTQQHGRLKQHTQSTCWIFKAL